MSRLVNMAPTVLSRADERYLRRMVSIIEKSEKIMGDGQPYQTYHSQAWDRMLEARDALVTRVRRMIGASGKPPKLRGVFCIPGRKEDGSDAAWFKDGKRIPAPKRARAR